MQLKVYNATTTFIFHSKINQKNEEVSIIPSYSILSTITTRTYKVKVVNENKWLTYRTHNDLMCGITGSKSASLDRIVKSKFSIIHRFKKLAFFVK